MDLSEYCKRRLWFNQFVQSEIMYSMGVSLIDVIKHLPPGDKNSARLFGYIFSVIISPKMGHVRGKRVFVNIWTMKAKISPRICAV